MATDKTPLPPTAPAPTAASVPRGHPPGLYLLFLVEMWERFSFYGMKANLVLYLACATTGMSPAPDGAPPGFNPGRGWADEHAKNLVGWYGGMAYLLPILGGLLADRLIGTHRSMVLGGLLIAAGHVALAISGLGDMAHNQAGLTVFIFGLALICVGTGHFKPSVSVMVGQLYAPDDPRRQGAFGIFYTGINVGAFLGIAVCAYLGERVGWHYGFGAAAVGMLAGLALYVLLRPRFLAGIGLPPTPSKAEAPGLTGSNPTLKAGARATQRTIAMSAAGVALCGLFAWAFSRGWTGDADTFLSDPAVATVAILAGFGLMIGFTATQPRGDRGRVASIFIFMLFNAVFWFGFEQAGTSITVFTDREVDRSVSGFLVPAGWFQNVNPFCIVLFAPLFGALWVWLARRHREPGQAVKIGLGLIIMGLGFLFLVLAGRQAQGPALASIWLVAAAYVFHTLGELFLSPTGLAYVTRAAPPRHTSLLMGVWFISSFLAMVIGGKVAGLTGDIEKGVIKLPWNFGGQADFFFVFVLLGVGAGVLILLASPWLKRLEPRDA